MPLQATSGAASYDAFGGGVPVVPTYIEDVFSTYLYTGNGSTQTITNGIDLSTKGGLVWIKARTLNADHLLYDTSRGVNKVLYSNSTVAQDTTTASLTAFNNNGFSVNATGGYTNSNTYPYVSWTFRKQPKFFDVVTYTGAGDGTTVSHNLGSTPGCVIVKATSGVDGWFVYHRSLTATTTSRYLRLDTTASEAFLGSWISVSDTTITFPTAYGPTAGTGTTYVAYLFAHNAGGFGLTGTDNVISCGSVSATGSTLAEVNLGYEPQWLLIKGSNITNGWSIIDNMRKFTADSGVSWLQPNTSAAEVTSPTTPSVYLTSTGFKVNSNESPLNGTGTYIYIAIRRGPMKVPTSGTSVFSPVTQTGNGTSNTITTGFPTDLVIGGSRTANPILGVVDRLRGRAFTLQTASTAAQDTSSSTQDLTSFASNTGYTLGTPFAASFNYSGADIYWNFQRAPSFFDEVCWTRSTTTATLNHNLGVVPELIIKKDRSRAGTYWDVMPNVSPYDYRYDIYLNDTQAISGPSSIYWNAAPTATTFDVHMGFDGSSNGDTFVAYLFATCAGVSKVGSYTGNGSSQTINCGFSSGSRFVLIKKTSGTGNWYVWDSARGIVPGNDPYLELNTTSAEYNSDSVDTDASGFVVNQDGTTGINASGATYIFLAIA